MDRWWELFTGAAFLALLLLSLLIAGAIGWGPPDDECWTKKPRPADACYCESIGERGEGMIRQPSNTWSALGFSVLGLVILGIRSYERANNVTPAHQNAMTTSMAFPLAYGLIVVYMGPGSMFFHASIRAWGGWLDSMSMVFWSDFLLVYSLIRLLKIPYREQTPAALLILGYIAVAVIMGVLIATMGEHATLLFGVVTTIAVLFLLVNQINLQRLGEANGASWAWLGAATGVFVVSLLIWKFAPCHANDTIQYHAIWHLGSAIGVFLVYWYFRSGDDPR